MNHKNQKKFSRLLTALKCICLFFWVLLQAEMTDFSTIPYPSNNKTPYRFIYLKPESKKVLFSGGGSLVRYILVVPPGQRRYFMNCDRHASSAFINVLIICLSVASTKCKPNNATLYHLFAVTSE